MALTSESRVRFVADSRNGDWLKGQLGTIEKVIVLPPQNQNELYIVRIHDPERLVWVTSRDIESNEQLSIFDALDALAKEKASEDNP